MFDLVPDTCGAESWVIQLSDGTLLATGWNVNLANDAGPKNNVFALSRDDGDTWSETFDTGILGQSTALVPLRDGTALFAYNQRISPPFGIGVAKIKPTEKDFGVLNHTLAWTSEGTAPNASEGHSEDFNWTNFTFGEPSFLKLKDGRILLQFWQSKGNSSAIRYVRLEQ